MTFKGYKFDPKSRRLALYTSPSPDTATAEVVIVTSDIFPGLTSAKDRYMAEEGLLALFECLERNDHIKRIYN